MRAASLKTRTCDSSFQGRPLRRAADAVKVQVGRRVSQSWSAGSLAPSRCSSRGRVPACSAAATPDWRPLLAGLAICAAVQPLRALAWTSTVRKPDIGFRAMYTASSVGSFLEIVLPGCWARPRGRGAQDHPVCCGRGPARGREPALRASARDDRLCARGRRLSSPAGSRLGEGDDGRRPPACGRRAAARFGAPRQAFAPPAPGVGAFSLEPRRRKPCSAPASFVVTWVARWFAVLFLLDAVGVHVGVGRRYSTWS